MDTFFSIVSFLVPSSYGTFIKQNRWFCGGAIVDSVHRISKRYGQQLVPKPPISLKKCWGGERRTTHWFRVTRVIYSWKSEIDDTRDAMHSECYLLNRTYSSMILIQFGSFQRCLRSGVPSSKHRKPYKNSSKHARGIKRAVEALCRLSFPPTRRFPKRTVNQRRF